RGVPPARAAHDARPDGRRASPPPPQPVPPRLLRRRFRIEEAAPPGASADLPAPPPGERAAGAGEPLLLGCRRGADLLRVPGRRRMDAPPDAHRQAATFVRSVLLLPRERGVPRRAGQRAARQPHRPVDAAPARCRGRPAGRRRRDREGGKLVSRPPVVVVGLGCPTGLQTARIFAARDIEVLGVATNLSHPCVRTRRCRRVVEAAPGPEGVVTALLSLAEELEGPAVLIPCTDVAVLGIARHRSRLSDHYLMALPAPEVVEA